MPMHTQLDDEKIIVESVTLDGRKFRPSDWIERLCDCLTSFGEGRRVARASYRGHERRARQLPFLWAQMIDGAQCLVVNLKLREANPPAFQFVMGFVQDNHLRSRQCRLLECVPPSLEEKEPGVQPGQPSRDMPS
jgi:hypothetical protein